MTASPIDSLPALLPLSLTPAEVEERLADPARLARAAGDVQSPDGMRRSAVLVPVLLHEAPTVLLTLRAATLSSHAGQVAFPGGRIEPGETPEAAALREAAEEVGLDPRLPRLAGRLPGLVTGTGFHVVPVVALLDPPVSLTPELAEVAEVFEYPLSRLLDPASPERRSGVFGGRTRHYWSWPHETQTIWGATATMLRSLALALRD
ncbi:CoA pyrophosphatase [Muricoccus pecuniae]|uniref:8-oxo-dGTP pyrophosphatase MutT (NUDIX family) n=1 Tax=Muricoccus pecuniae TaxID=693023 RepID=A0A840YK01_9PROT|nr:CoA pyrophosphatase [Roseomonas pecuniae]MBB5694633.1 8-oxo-dGTP pyrophosphatase MutT (NUDIX family) [Roseomonas pecuniae]